MPVWSAWETLKYFQLSKQLVVVGRIEVDPPDREKIVFISPFCAIPLHSYATWIEERRRHFSACNGHYVVLSEMIISPLFTLAMQSSFIRQHAVTSTKLHLFAAFSEKPALI